MPALTGLGRALLGSYCYRNVYGYYSRYDSSSYGSSGIGRNHWVQEVIAAAGIPAGPHASPKGLRHGFGVQAVSKGIALNMVQKWLGHAQLTTTAIYADAVGEEEQSIAARMW